jgi:hypothetical protein
LRGWRVAGGWLAGAALHRALPRQPPTPAPTVEPSPPARRLP